jgi:hypothetical protein
VEIKEKRFFRVIIILYPYRFVVFYSERYGTKNGFVIPDETYSKTDPSTLPPVDVLVKEEQQGEDENEEGQQQQKQTKKVKNVKSKRENEFSNCIALKDTASHIFDQTKAFFKGQEEKSANFYAVEWCLGGKSLRSLYLFKKYALDLLFERKKNALLKSSVDVQLKLVSDKLYLFPLQLVQTLDSLFFKDKEASGDTSLFSVYNLLERYCLSTANLSVENYPVPFLSRAAYNSWKALFNVLYPAMYFLQEGKKEKDESVLIQLPPPQAPPQLLLLDNVNTDRVLTTEELTEIADLDLNASGSPDAWLSFHNAYARNENSEPMTTFQIPSFKFATRSQKDANTDYLELLFHLNDHYLKTMVIAREQTKTSRPGLKTNENRDLAHVWNQLVALKDEQALVNFYRFLKKDTPLILERKGVKAAYELNGLQEQNKAYRPRSFLSSGDNFLRNLNDGGPPERLFSVMEDLEWTGQDGHRLVEHVPESESEIGTPFSKPEFDSGKLEKSIVDIADRLRKSNRILPDRIPSCSLSTVFV